MKSAPKKNRSDELKPPFAGMTMKQARRSVPAKDEKGKAISGIYEVDLEVDWTSDNEPQARKLSFYVLRDR